ncbi:MAG: hypothetical protein CMC13_02580 [Flavobacteriaceae bacterium]|nr:hypothetical protein [Flavobacteriaceae bacterium]
MLRFVENQRIMKAQLFFTLILMLLSSVAFCQGRVQSTQKVISPFEEARKDTIQIRELVISGNDTIVKKRDSLIQVESNPIDKWSKVNSVSIYGGGSLLGLVTAEENIEDASSPSGSLGLNFSTQRITCDLFFSYNAKQEIDMNSLAAFGSALMNPNLGGQSLTFKTTAKVGRFYGVNGSLLVADNIWKLDEEEKIDASPLVARVGFYIRPFQFNLADNEVDVSFDAHYTHRSILGDFNNAEQSIAGTKIVPRGYNGGDFSVNAYMNAVKVYAQFSVNSTRGFIIPGFSGTQVLFGIEVTGDVIKLE